MHRKRIWHDEKIVIKLIFGQETKVDVNIMKSIIENFNFVRHILIPAMGKLSGLDFSWKMKLIWK